MDGLTDGRRQTGWREAGKNGWRNGWMHELMDGLADGRTNERISYSLSADRNTKPNNMSFTDRRSIRSDHQVHQSVIISSHI